MLNRDGRPPQRPELAKGRSILMDIFSAPEGSSVRLGSFNQALHQLPEDRKHLIFRIRRQIAENTYDTPAKLDSALERMIDSLNAPPSDHSI